MAYAQFSNSFTSFSCMVSYSTSMPCSLLCHTGSFQLYTSGSTSDGHVLYKTNFMFMAADKLRLVLYSITFVSSYPCRRIYLWWSKAHLQVPLTEYSEIYQFLPDVSGKMDVGIFCTHAWIPESKTTQLSVNQRSRILPKDSSSKIQQALKYL